MNRKHGLSKVVGLVAALMMLSLALGTTACTSQQTAKDRAEQDEASPAALAEVHVAPDGSDEAGDGTEAAPYASVSRAAEAAPGSLVIMHGGNYGPIELGPDCSGTEASPTVIRAASGEAPVIHAEDGACVSLTDVHHLSVEGLETEGGTYGIDCRSTREVGDQPLADISIRNCKVHGVRGVHGICVYACNDLAPVTNLAIEGCEIYDCECGSSESLVLNGNIDGFLIAGNTIHDNNNIGIDMIGFEGTAMHPDDAGDKNPYEVDQARNGVCRDNVVYNISSEGNPAYLEDGEYDLCADGIYVDGGRDIEICNNFIFNCDIGLEVATEHSPDDNELFRVSGISVHDNVIASCMGCYGICFGGYDKDLGLTEDCEFDHNTLVDNIAQIGVQRSRNNRISANLIVGGEVAIEYSEECRKEDMVNDIGENAQAEVEDEDSWNDTYGKAYASRADVVDGYRSLVENCGSRFVPSKDLIHVVSR